MRFRLNITPKLTLILVLFAAVLLAGVSTLAYTSGRSALRSAAVVELFSSAIEKQAGLNSWISETETYAVSLATSPYMQKLTSDLQVSRLSGDQTAIQTVSRLLIAELQTRVGESQGYLAWNILDPRSGQVIVSTDPGEEGKFRENQAFFINGRVGPYLQNVYYSPATQGVLLTVSAPILADDGSLVGVLAGNLDLAKMNAIITRRTGLRQSDDAFLVNSSELFVTQPRFVSDPAVLLRGVHTIAVKSCLNRNSGVVTADDYRGIPSFIVYRWLPDRQLCLVVKMDQAEALAPVMLLGKNILLISSFALLLAAALAFLLARTITRPVQELAKVAGALGAGNLDVRSEIKTGDEIEHLNTALTGMAQNLQKSLVSRDELLKEVSERKQVEEALRETNEYLDNLFNYANAPIIVWDPQFCITRFNHAFEILTGRTLAEVIGKPLEILFPPAQIHASMEQIKKTSTGERWEIVEISIQHLDGSVRTVLWNSATLFSSDGKTPQATIAQGQDITERKQAEKKLASYADELEGKVEERTRQLHLAQEKNIRKERLATLGQVAGSIGHELRNPLGVISNAVYFLRMSQPEASDIIKEYLDIIENETRTSDKFITELLDFTRIKAMDRKSVLVSELVRQALDRYSVPSSVDVALDLPPGLPPLFADPQHVIQVLGNLIVNACQSMENGGIMTIAARAQGDMISIAVQDTGAGVLPGNMDKLFEPLFTTKVKGIGLGLAVSQKLAEANGGRIEVHSEHGKGSIFTLFLPASL